MLSYRCLEIHVSVSYCHVPEDFLECVNNAIATAIPRTIADLATLN